ncbi:hypothetical protein WN944_027251 [Citrus x changshan-huyou]|uniref:Uncharacterized protein n=1 Tax=Citrus x changshan-huyou TaxID=2935761 RepID=A0AAP0LI74_9ROSI
MVMEIHPQEKNVVGVQMMKQGGVDENKEVAVQLQVGEGDFSLLGPRNYGHSTRHYDKPLSCFGCGIGWFLFLLGFAFPPIWYCATVLYLGKYYLKDPRERSGLAASAIASIVFAGFDLLGCSLDFTSCCVLVADYAVINFLGTERVRGA